VDDEPGSSPEDGSITRQASHSPLRPFFTSGQREQYILAGLQPGEDIPPHPFPHAPARPHATILERARNELHSLNPPLAHIDPSWYEPYSKHNVQNEGEPGLREKHLAVLTTVMHHMLLKGDYQRAGRAWGLLLRSGRLTKNLRRRGGYLSMDVTAHNRWGIGAEILMRNNQKTSENSQNPEDVQFSQKGFRAAREYYERLIVQYPEHHQRKGAKASTFYAAMFSLWIYEVSQKSKLAEKELMNSERESTTPPALGDPSLNNSPEDGTEIRVRAVKSEELKDARAIASRLDDVLGSPPHDKNAELLQIRGMVALWIGGLQGGDAQDTALDRAKDLFLRSQANGGMLWEGVEHIAEEDDW
jgi:hypothetical protein